MPKRVKSLSELLRDTQSVKPTKGDVMSDTLDSDCQVTGFFTSTFFLLRDPTSGVADVSANADFIRQGLVKAVARDMKSHLLCRNTYEPTTLRLHHPMSMGRSQGLRNWNQRSLPECLCFSCRVCQVRKSKAQSWLIRGNLGLDGILLDEVKVFGHGHYGPMALAWQKRGTWKVRALRPMKLHASLVICLAYICF